MKKIGILLTALTLLGACDGGQRATESLASIDARAAAVTDTTGPVINQEIATLRQVTSKFHDFQAAVGAGWSAQITGCMVDANGAGGMGFHYGNTDLIDGSASVDQPELLLYEPDKSGKLTLVAVEYIIPYTFHSRDAEPPVLFGRQFKQNDVFQLWGLHAWVWENNPSGMFANWNPKVTCENAASVSRMSH